MGLVCGTSKKCIISSYSTICSHAQGSHSLYLLKRRHPLDTHHPYLFSLCRPHPATFPGCYFPCSMSHVQVTYSGPGIYLQSDQWTQVKTSLISQLPLRNLHWKPATRPSIRTIQELDIDLVPFETVKDEPVSQIPTSMLDRPFLNVFVIACEVRSRSGFPTLVWLLTKRR